MEELNVAKDMVTKLRYENDVLKRIIGSLE